MQRKLIFIAVLVSVVFIVNHHANKILAQGNNANKCGNGVCQASAGETAETCPADCSSGVPPTPTPQPTSPPQPTQDPTPGIEPTSPPDPESTPTVSPTDTTSSSSISSESDSDDTSDSQITIILNPQFSSPTNNSSLSFNGNAVTENSSIQSIQHSLDNSTWTDTTLTDGIFDSSSEGFSFQITSLSDGEYTVYVKATSIDGATQDTQTSFKISTVPPEIVLDESEQSAETNAIPTIGGTIKTTENAISKVEVSLDGGKSWLQAQFSGNSFSYTFESLEDGNYELMAKVVDVAGNIAQTEPISFVVDTIPPTIGSSLFSIGGLKITSLSDGTITIPVNIPIQHIVSTVGGMTNISSSDTEANYEKIPNMNLFKGEIIFNTPGEYFFELWGEDGAGNKTERFITTINVMPQGKISDNKNQEPISSAIVQVHYFNPYLRKWLEWDGEIFDQNHTLQSNENGGYSIFFPAGRYFLSVKADGYREAQSSIFAINEPSIIVQDISMHPAPALQLPILGSMPFNPINIVPSFFDIDPISYVSNNTQVQEYIPSSDGVITDPQGSEYTPEELFQDKTLITFISEWMPQSLEQLALLDSFYKNIDGEIDVYVINIQDSYVNSKVFKNRGAYSFDIWSDEQGKISQSFNVSSLPHHVLIDEDLNIRGVHVGTLDENGYNELLVNF